MIIALFIRAARKLDVRRLFSPRDHPILSLLISPKYSQCENFRVNSLAPKPAIELAKERYLLAA